MTTDHISLSHSKERLKAHTEMDTRPCLWNGSPSCPSACPRIENSSWEYLSNYKALDGQEEAETQVGRRPHEGPPAPSSLQHPRILPRSLSAETWPLPHPITTEPYHQKQEQCCPGMDFSVRHDIGRQPPDTRPHSCANSLLTGSPTAGPGNSTRNAHSMEPRPARCPSRPCPPAPFLPGSTRLAQLDRPTLSPACVLSPTRPCSPTQAVLSESHSLAAQYAPLASASLQAICIF